MPARKPKEPCPIIACTDHIVVKGFCQKHYHSCGVATMNHGWSKEQYITWKNKFDAYCAYLVHCVENDLEIVDPPEIVS